MACAWTVAAPQPIRADDPDQPAPRYGHGAVVRGSFMTVTHGYYYDLDAYKPRYLDDSWSYDAAARLWTPRDEGGPRPCKRFHVACCRDATHLFLHGGTDGGLRWRRRAGRRRSFVRRPAATPRARRG